MFSHYNPFITLSQLYELLPDMYRKRIEEEKNEKVRMWLINQLNQLLNKNAQ